MISKIIKNLRLYNNPTKIYKDPIRLYVKPPNASKEDIGLKQVEEYWKDIFILSNEPTLDNYKLLSSHSKLDLSQANDLITKLIYTDKALGDWLPCQVAKSCCHLYENLDKEGKIEYIKLLISNFDINRKEINKIISQYMEILESKDDLEELYKIETQLRDLLTPKYDMFFERVQQLPNGMRFLVSMREEAIKWGKEEKKLRIFETKLKSKIQSWLIGFLSLQRVSWTTPAITLEKIVQYERVHPIKTWDDLKRRLGPGRRCFSFFHKSMPFDPLVFVQVALVDEIPVNMKKILNEGTKYKVDNRSQKIHCAAFYSINTQKGVSGVDLGAFLIKRVVIELQTEFPYLDQFVTLSPIPFFRNWLVQQLSSKRDDLLSDEEIEKLNKLNVFDRSKNNKTINDALQKILSNKDCMSNEEFCKVLELPMKKWCVEYLFKEGRYSKDPVANFHLRNGACVHQINFLANTSDKGFKESLGLMINYNYLLEHIESNNQIYLRNGVINVSNRTEYFTSNSDFRFID